MTTCAETCAETCATCALPSRAFLVFAAVPHRDTLERRGLCQRGWTEGNRSKPMDHSATDKAKQGEARRIKAKHWSDRDARNFFEPRAH